MKKSRIIPVLFLSALFSLASCGAAEPSEELTNANEKIDNASLNADGKQKNKPAVMNDLGIYVGQVDPHTVEIETNEGPKAFQLTDQSAKQIDALQPNDNVRFEYIINKHKQNVLQSIEKINAAENNTATKEIGIYNGQQDPHTIEIDTQDGPKTFQLSDEAIVQIESLQTGQKVAYTYRINGLQRLIETIQPVEESNKR